MNKKRKSNNTKQEHNLLRSIIFQFAIVVIGTSAIVYGPSIYKLIVFQRTINEFEMTGIPNNRICMVGNEIKLRDTKPLTINSLVYWSCCERCDSKLRGNRNNVQISVDPQTGNKINKAKAIVRLDPYNRGQLLFFESNESYERFICSSN